MFWGVLGVRCLYSVFVKIAFSCGGRGIGRNLSLFDGKVEEKTYGW